MKKFKKWLYEKYLPFWCKDELEKENAKLLEKLYDAERENQKLRAYIDGMNNVLKRQRRQNLTVYGGKEGTQ